MTTDRTTIQLTDERKRLLEQASEIVASDQSDDPQCRMLLMPH